MKETIKTGPIIAFGLVIILFLFFGGSAMTGTTMSGGMMGSGNFGGISWMWLPTVLTLGIGVFLGWAIFRKK